MLTERNPVPQHGDMTCTTRHSLWSKDYASAVGPRRGGSEVVSMDAGLATSRLAERSRSTMEPKRRMKPANGHAEPGSQGRTGRDGVPFV